MHIPDKLFLALTPDGGRRAADNNLGRYAESYTRGAEIVADVLKLCVRDERVKIFTAWGLSDDNKSKRSPAELKILNTIFIDYLDRLRSDVETEDYRSVKVVHMGDEELLHPEVITRIHDISAYTSERSEKIFGLCLAYGSHNEMDRAIRLSHAQPEKNWKEFLDLPRRGNIPYQHVDAMIRTGTDPLEPYTSAYLLPYQGPATQERYIETFLPHTTAEQIMAVFDGICSGIRHKKLRLGA